MDMSISKTCIVCNNCGDFVPKVTSMITDDNIVYCAQCFTEVWGKPLLEIINSNHFLIKWSNNAR